MERLNPTEGDLFKTGDNDTWEAFVSKTQSSIKRTIYRTGIPTDTVDDIVQNTYLDLFERRNKIDLTRNLPAYTRRVARSRAVDYLRHQSLYPHFSSSDTVYETSENSSISTALPDVEDEVMDNETLDELLSAIGTLPPKYQELLLPRLTGFVQEDIANMLSMPTSTVQARTFRAMRDLRKQLQKEE